METDGKWGDELILRAAANYYKTDICVVSSLGHEKEQTISPFPNHLPTNTTNKPLVLGHVHELHYVSLIPRQGNDEIN